MLPLGEVKFYLSFLCGSGEFGNTFFILEDKREQHSALVSQVESRLLFSELPFLCRSLFNLS